MRREPLERGCCANLGINYGKTRIFAGAGFDGSRQFSLEAAATLGCAGDDEGRGIVCRIQALQVVGSAGQGIRERKDMKKGYCGRLVTRRR